MAAEAAGAAAPVAHARAGGAAAAGPPVRDGRGAAGRQRARPAEGRDPGVPAGAARRARLLRHHRAGRAGGLGLGVFEYCMVSEELARAWMSTASILARSQGLGTALADDRPPQRAARPQRPRRVDRRDRAVRARRRLRPGRGLHPRRPRRRRVGGDRPQALVRQREGRRLHPGAGARARPGGGRVAVEGPGQPAAGEEARRVPRGA